MISTDHIENDVNVFLLLWSCMTRYLIMMLMLHFCFLSYVNFLNDNIYPEFVVQCNISNLSGQYLLFFTQNSIG